MGNFKEYQKKNGNRIYVCDMCLALLNLREVILTDPDSARLKMIGDQPIFIDKDGLVSTGRQPDPEKGDQVMSCPHCGAKHPFGFKLADRVASQSMEVGHT